MNLSVNYMKAMAIGAKLSKTDLNTNPMTVDWNACEECRCLARIASSAIDYKNEEKSFMEMVNCIIDTINYLIDGMSNYDEWARGFIAGEIFGEYTNESLEKAKKAEEIWLNDETKGYYQEVCNEIKRSSERKI